MFTIRHLILALAALGLGSANAQQTRFQQEAALGIAGQNVQRAWVSAVTGDRLTYYTTAAAVESRQAKLSDVELLWLMEPKEYTAAMALYQARDYTAALKAFNQVRATYRPLATLANNHSALAAYYALECLRKTDQFSALAKALKDFKANERDSLTRPFQRTQLQLDELWVMLDASDWPQIEQTATTLLGKPLPGFQRAQAAYCLGLALENQQREDEALDAYNVALTADTGASESVARRATIHALQIYLSRDGVAELRNNYPPAEGEKNVAGLADLQAAGALAVVYDLGAGGADPLPGELADLAQYAPEKDQLQSSGDEAPEVPGEDSEGSAEDDPATEGDADTQAAPEE